MKKNDQIQLIESSGIIAILRFRDPKKIIDVASALAEGGIKAIEFTMNTPGALRLLEQASESLDQSILLGAGTVIDVETARSAILSGAQFIVSPNLDLSVIEMCRRYSKVVIPGAFTPSEILKAWDYGADFVKLFPVEIGGQQFIKAIKAPLPQVKLIPVGGVSLENIPSYIEAGATAFGVGSNLVNKQLIVNGELEKLTELAGQYIRAFQKGKG